MTNIATVSTLVGYLKRSLDRDLKIQNLLIKGEISNFTHHRSGHFYFTLKDSKSRINCVMFKTYSSNIKFSPKDGDMVLLKVNTSVYEGSGQLQLYVISMQLDGIGDLYLDYEKLKKKLIDEGLFANEHKLPINKYPKRIAVVVGKNTAAREDVISTLKRRWPVAEITECNVLVQGDNSARQIVRALKKIDYLNFDTIILARGGGSIEDLWSFNNEELARVIFNLKTPLISGVGHESDTTIVDYVADLRAPTPTGAGELACNDIIEVNSNISNYKNKLEMIINNRIKTNRNSFISLINSPVFKDPYYLTKNKHLKLDYTFQKLVNYKSYIQSEKGKLTSLENKLNFIIYSTINNKTKLINLKKQKIISSINLIYTTDLKSYQRSVALLNAYSPLQILSRGYTLTYKDGLVVKDCTMLNVDDELDIRFNKGIVKATVKEKYNDK
jgi:exodeoxyribonuclease VII large subunit